MPHNRRPIVTAKRNDDDERLFTRSSIPIMITLAVGMLAIGGFYYTTLGRLDSHDRALEKIVTQVESVRLEGDKSRDQMRDSLSTLTTKAAVQELQAKTVTDQLSRVIEQLQLIQASNAALGASIHAPVGNHPIR